MVETENVAQYLSSPRENATRTFPWKPEPKTRSVENEDGLAKSRRIRDARFDGFGSSDQDQYHSEHLEPNNDSAKEGVRVFCHSRTSHIAGCDCYQPTIYLRG